MHAPTVSVIIVSRDRPEALDLCLTGVAQLDYPSFEVIVVACPRGAQAVKARDDAARIKLVPYDSANISAARNRGIAVAAGDIVAFIDDDAVPEPTWLRHLAGAFDDPNVSAAGGYVRARNGIAFQWRARTVDARGIAAPLRIEGDQPVMLTPDPGEAIKTEGANMALRRDVLAGIGGFDPAFRFYLDETDLNIRLAKAGHATAIVPLAQVHHGYGASARRHADRSPRDLTEIGASLAVYLRKHCPEDRRDAVWRRFQAEQRQRLLRLMQCGPLGADDVWRLLRGLRRGWRAGLERGIDAGAPLPEPHQPFLPYPGRPDAPHCVFAGRVWQSRSLHAAARQAVTQGEVATVFRLSPTALYHRMTFHRDGFWEQTGGVLGRSARDQPLFRLTGFRKRIAQERKRLWKLRHFAP